MREVVHIDIAKDRISSKDYKADLDPTIYKSKKTKRGPLDAHEWQKSVNYNISSAASDKN